MKSQYVCLGCGNKVIASADQGKCPCGEQFRCAGPARSVTPPPVPTDRVRLHVAMWHLAQALGLNWTSVDASRPDYELVDEICAAVAPALAAEFKRGHEEGVHVASEAAFYEKERA